MPVTFYRYISYPQEVTQVRDERKVQSTNPNTQHATWYTLTRYDDPVKAQQELAPSTQPTHRVGPIPADGMPDFDIGPRPVAPAHGHPGGGVEVRTKSPVWLFGFRDFPNNDWVL